MSANKGVIALAAGGTGGHLFPAEALAQELKRRGWRILLVTDERGARYAATFPADDRFMITAASPSIGGPVAKAAAALSLSKGVVKAVGEFRRRRISAAVGFGGYPSFPAMMAAKLTGTPFGVHEQNAVLGRVNRFVAGGGAFLAHGFPSLALTPKNAQRLLVEVGNPVRDLVSDAARTAFPPIDETARINILIFGGSQGASVFSHVVPQAIAKLPENLRKRLNVTQQVRDPEISGVRSAYDAAGVSAVIEPFFSDLPARIAQSHLVIARAGASTVTELSAIGRPSVLVPLAIAMDDHQTGNARALSDAGAAVTFSESDFTADALRARLHDLLQDPALLRHMAAAAKGRVKADSASTLADIVEKIATAKVKAAA